MTDFNRAEQVGRIADLERQAGAALLDGEPFDHAPLTEARSHLEQIEQAEAEKQRRAREQEGAAKAARRAELRADGVRIAADYRKALDEAETHAARLREALRSATECARTLAMLGSELGLRPSSDLDPIAFENRLSGCIAEMLAPISINPRAFGHMKNLPPNPDPRGKPRKFSDLSRIIPDFGGTD